VGHRDHVVNHHAMEDRTLHPYVRSRVHVPVEFQASHDQLACMVRTVNRAICNRHFTRASELVWIKLNLMQNLVRTGRTGHFLNHSKEHCLIGVKGDPPLGAEQHGFRRDCDVLVSELRESSRKPEEIYGVAQRLWPGARCLELFARQHNVGKPGWVAVGNQLDGSVVVDPELKRRLRERYPRVDFA